MRPIATVLLLMLPLAGACGRIGYTPLEVSGVGGTFAVGAGGSLAGSGGAGVGGAVQPAGTGGMSGSGGNGGGGAGAGSGEAIATGTGGSGSGGNATGGSGSGGNATGGSRTGGNGTGGNGTGGTAGAIATGGNGTGGGAPATGGRGTGGLAGTGGAAGQVAATGGSGAGGSGASCATDTFGGHSYAFCIGPATWADAQADCSAKGMRLVRIDDSAENAWVQSVAFTGVSSMSSVYWSWIGATDAAVSKQWRWTDGALFWMGGASGTPQGGLYSNWAGGSPSNGGTGADCGILEHSGFWKDFDCAIPERYVCERY